MAARAEGQLGWGRLPAPEISTSREPKDPTSIFKLAGLAALVAAKIVLEPITDFKNKQSKKSSHVFNAWLDNS